MSSEARPAATVIILRESPQGPEVLMLKRSGHSGFFPNAWVFPGGRVDESDATVRSRGAVLGMSEEDRDYAVAAIRETFEEAGVWLGDGHPSEELRAALNDRTGTLHDAPDLVADLGRLAAWSWWITPESEPKRYDTRFFIALLDRQEAERAHHDEQETVEHTWICPKEAVCQAEAGDFFLAPPTYLTLCELAFHETGLAAMHFAAGRRVRPIMPRLDAQDGQWAIVLPGDPSYPTEHPVEGPTKVEFRDGRWWSA
jgi:8-oxo-dGTP pyrophosphatase MutT (NUDIX family)